MTDGLRIAVLGATGRTGRLVVEAARGEADIEVVACLSLEHPLAMGCFADAEVVVDFSHPEALAAAVPFLGGRALVTGTTGLGRDVDELVSAHARSAPVVVAANFSTGVNALLDLVERAARMLPDYDVEIVEAHHRHKRDAPSGTALALARAAAAGRGAAFDAVALYGRHGLTGERPHGQIAVHALRMGDVVGEHQVWLAGPGDRICLGHAATSREAFARGALRAARWACGRAPGRYSMRDVLDLGG